MLQAGDGLRPYLRRAFSIADVTTVAGVPAIEFVVKAVGVGTGALGRLPEGTPVPVLGPLGVPFPTDDLKPGDRVALVAGGIGLAPLVLLARTLAARGLAADLYYGGRNENDVLKRADFERFLGPHRCRYATDDGSLGRRGRVTDILAHALEGGTLLPARLRVRPASDVQDARRARREGGPRRLVRDGVRDGVRLRRLPRLRRADGGRPLRDDLQGRALRAPVLHRLEEDLMAVDLTVQMGRLRLKNPIATASGTFGYGLEFADYLDLSALGAISVKGLSRRPCHGNPPPRICETDAGMLNAIGLQNVGVDAFLAEKLPELHAKGATVIANVWGDAEEDYVAVVERIGADRRVAAIELNVSCPNVVKGGMIFGNNPQALSALVKKVRAATPHVLVVKLSPNVTDIVAVAAGGGGRRRRRALAHQHARRPRDRPRDADAEDRLHDGGPLRPGHPAGRPADGLGSAEGAAEDPDLRDGRDRDRRERRRVPRRRRERRPDRHRELPGSLARRAARRRARRLVRASGRSRASRTSSGP